MNISKEFIDKILNCPWLQNCGKKDSLEVGAAYLDKTADVRKYIVSLKWENLCLDKQGDFTTYLFKNYRDEFNKYWNETVRMIKKEYMPAISDRINERLLRLGLPGDVLDDMKMNIVSLFMLEYYSEYYSCDFYESILKIYMAGHLPCGWKGKYPEGKFLVF
ncbi:MAG: hypothetical protein J6J42_13440 [Lachnospiraceae bacterium]|nr:hypothetical protein [Lachnospiraceae bacterium]